MTSIQSSTGIITGIPIQDTVDKLMALAAQPKDTLTSRTKTLDVQRQAVTQLNALLVAFQFETNQLGSASLFDSRQASSSDSNALTASVSDTTPPAVGNYLFTPVQTATAQQLMSQSFGATETVGAGTLTFGTGGFVDPGISLDELNSGAGFERGKVRITDRSGATAVIDLSYARSVDDVLEAINSSSDINVTATAVGDTFKLVDNTGGSGNFKVQEVGGGKTAASLGFTGVDVAAATVTGADVFTLHNKTSLKSLNDGTGVQLRTGKDLSVALADQSTLEIDLGDAKTLGDVLNTINAAAPTKLSASISSDGNRLELHDLTSGGGIFAVSNVGVGTAATDLGLITTAAGGTVTGRRLASGLRDTLISNLKGGAGLGTLGHVTVKNRNNITSDVNLTGSETLGQIIDAFNSQAAGVTATINPARNGIQLTDKTGATATNFTITNADATNTASHLGIMTDSSSTTVNGGGLQRRQISAATLLSSLNGGAGIDVGDFKITGTTGITGAVDLNTVDDVATTVGDVLARINSLAGVGVEARINDRGDGIELIDNLDGNGSITVTAVGNNTTAKDLRLLGTSVATIVNGSTKQVVDGTATATITIDSDDTLSDVVKKINDSNRGVTASILNAGGQQRLSIVANNTGAGNELLIDTSNSTLSLQELSSGRDALVLYGTTGGNGVLVSSTTNTFTNIVSGLNLTIKDGTQKPVTINVSSTSSQLVNSVKEFVSAYNSVRETIDKTTAYDPDTLTTGILFGTTEALRVDTDLAHVVTSKFYGVGAFDSLSVVGISVDDKGKMTLDESKLKTAFDKNPAAIKKLFTDKDRGVAKKLSDTVEILAGEKNSLLTARTDSLTDMIEANNKRIDTMTDQLSRQRDTLLLQFYNLEATVSKLKNNLNALASLQVISPLTSAK
ncbi:MAG: flagellar filament capping protein FliD [Pirellulales bacterium]